MGDKNSESRVNDDRRARAQEGQGEGRTPPRSSTSPAPTPRPRSHSSTASSRSGRREGVNTVFLAGNDVSVEEFVEPIKARRYRRRSSSPTPTPRSSRAATRSPRARSRTRTRDPDQRHGPHAVGALGEQEPAAPEVRRRLREGDRQDGARSRGRRSTADGKKVQTDVAVIDVCGELFMFRDHRREGGPEPDAQELAEDGRLLRPDRAGAQPVSRRCARASTPPTTGSDWSRSTPSLRRRWRLEEGSRRSRTPATASARRPTGSGT